jgi:hypothetical protein
MTGRDKAACADFKLFIYKTACADFKLFIYKAACADFCFVDEL